MGPTGMVRGWARAAAAVQVMEGVVGVPWIAGAEGMAPTDGFVPGVAMPVDTCLSEQPFGNTVPLQMHLLVLSDFNLPHCLKLAIDVVLGVQVLHDLCKKCNF